MSYFIHRLALIIVKYIAFLEEEMSVKNVLPKQNIIFPGGSTTLIEECARDNVKSLCCIPCGARDVVLDGKAKNRLRLRCRSCGKSVYADSHPTVKALAVKAAVTASPGSSSSECESEVAQTPVVAQQKKLDTSSVQMELDEYPVSDVSMSDGDFMEDEELDLPPIQDQVSHLFCETEDLANDLQTVKAENASIKREVSNLCKLITTLKDKIVELTKTQQANSPAAATGPVSSQQDQAHSTVTEDSPSPWLTAARKGKANVIQKQVKTNLYNHFDELLKVIPAYRKLTKEEIESNNFKVKKSKKINGDLSRDEINRIKNGKTAKKLSPMVVLHFEGVKRNRITDIKSMIKSIGIPTHWIRNISFIGRSIMELMTFQDRTEEIISKFETYEINYLQDYNPLSIDNIKDNTKFINLSVEDKQKLAEKLYYTRMEKTLERLPQTGINTRIRNFINSRLQQNKLKTKSIANIDNTATQEELQTENQPDITELKTRPVPFQFSGNVVNIDKMIVTDEVVPTDHGTKRSSEDIGTPSGSDTDTMESTGRKTSRPINTSDIESSSL